VSLTNLEIGSVGTDLSYRGINVFVNLQQDQAVCGDEMSDLSSFVEAVCKEAMSDGGQ